MKYCAVVGNPVSQSLSPQMHNAGYKHLGLDFVYEAREFDKALDLVEFFRSHPAYQGMSVTIPFKEDILALVDKYDDSVAKIGAANTLYKHKDEIWASNTDWIGAKAALEENSTLANKKILLLGAGGSARAIAYAMSQIEGTETIILNRSLERAVNLAKEFGLKAADLLDKAANYQDVDVIINSTSVGLMDPDSSPLNESFQFNPKMLVMDIVYKPLVTKLLKQAQHAGAQIITGEKMLIHQGLAQFEIFTGKKIPAKVFVDALAGALPK